MNINYLIKSSILFLLLSIHVMALTTNEKSELFKDKEDAQNSPSMASEIADKWFKRGDHDIALGFDNLYVLDSPYMASAIADKWFNRGKRDIALEFDNLYAQKSSYMASEIANKWFDRGDHDIALGFDNLYVLDSPDMASEIADMWFDRGNHDIALEFDNLFVQKSPDKASEIADKWFNRGNPDIALEFDNLFVQKSPDMASEIANMWYKRGEKELAFEFDNLYVQKSPDMASEIADKWFKRGEKELAFEFEKIEMQNRPPKALKKLDRLIKTNKFAEAEEFGNKILEYWVSLSDEEIQKDLWYKLKLAALMESAYYYEILKSKLIDKDDFIQEHYTKFLENIPISPELKDISITDYLTPKIKINPEFLDNFNISLDSARKMIEIDLYELAKKSDITFSILHVIALYAKQDPYFALHIFYENPLGDSGSGQYWGSLKRAGISQHPLRSKFFRGALVHEWTHQAMHILFDNYSNPYAKDDEKMQMQWVDAMNQVMDKLKEHTKELKIKSLIGLTNTPFDQMLILFNTIHQYSTDKYSSEAIARFVETVGMGNYEDPQVKSFLQPIYDYWVQYIDPTIKKYIQDHAKLNTFVSDWERENILDPFYRFETEKDEFAQDFKTVQSQTQKISPLYYLINYIYKNILL